jgi:hypothetical protein
MAVLLFQPHKFVQPHCYHDCRKLENTMKGWPVIA